MINRNKKNKVDQESQINLLKELEWAHIYHDSIRGKSYLENLSVNIGRWAGNYSFFYVLNRILHDYKPKRIIEFGLGESSKYVSTCLDAFLLDSEHIIIEQNKDWLNTFNEKFQLSKRSQVQIFPLIQKEINKFRVNYYNNLTETISDKFDFYIVDGPFGSERYSRYNIVELAEKFTEDDEFIVMIDDCQRKGEKDTFNDLVKLFESKNIEIFTSSYGGVKTVNLIATRKYRFSKTL